MRVPASTSAQIVRTSVDDVDEEEDPAERPHHDSTLRATRRRQRRMARMLPVTADGVRLFLHVLAATIWVGGQITAGRAAAGAAQRRCRRAAGGGARVRADRLDRLRRAHRHRHLEHRGRRRHQRHGYQTTLGIKLAVVALAGLAAWWHQRARSRLALAAGGAAAALFSLVALFLGVVLAEH